MTHALKRTPVEAPTALAILTRADALLASPLPHAWADCLGCDLGPYCPCCAIATAKGELTRGLAFDVGDDALAAAADAITEILGTPEETLSEADARAVVQLALSRVSIIVTH